MICNPQISKRSERGSDVARVQGAENKSTGTGGPQSDTRILRVSNLTDKYDIGIHAEKGSEAATHRDVMTFIDIQLSDKWHVEFDRVLNRYYISVRATIGIEHGIHRRSLS